MNAALASRPAVAIFQPDIDYSQLCDDEFADCDPKTVGSLPNYEHRDDAERELVRLARSLEADAAEHVEKRAPVPRAPTAEEAAAIKAQMAKSPACRSLLYRARMAAHLRAYLTRLEIERHEAEQAEQDQRVTELRKVAEIDPEVIGALLGTISKAADAEAFLLKVAAQLGTILQSHYAAERARFKLAGIYSEAIRARRELVEHGIDAPELAEQPEIPQPSNEALRAAKALRTIKHAFSPELAVFAVDERERLQVASR